MEEKENIDYVVCKICGTKKRIITQHLRCKHNMTKEEYIEKYNSPVVCKARQDIQVERNKELNKMLSTDPYYVELMKQVRHRNALLPQVIEAKLVKWNEYLHSELNAERTRQRMLDPYYQNLCTQGKLKSQKFHDQKSEQMKELSNKNWSNDEWKENHLKKMYDGNKKEYTDVFGNKVFFRSEWELKLHEYLISNEINYEYESLEIKYVYSGKEHKYFPDFYIESLNLVLEVKPQMFLNNNVNQIKRQATMLAGFNFKFVTEKELKDLNSFFHNL